MKILVWGINYFPELTGIAVYNTGLCEYLAKCGHDVTALTGFAYYPRWKKQASDRFRLYRRDFISSTEQSPKVQVIRSYLFVPERPNVFLRIIHEFSFVFSSLLILLFRPKYDLYVIVSPPLLLGFAASIVKLIKGAKFVFHVQDMQPDAAVGLGMVRSGVFIKLLYWLESFSYSQAAFVSGISNEMCRNFLDKGVAQEKIVFFPNWVDRYVLNSSVDIRAKYALKARTKIVSYSGNFGVKQGLETVIDAAGQLRDCVELVFVMAGEGARFSAIKRQIEELNLGNVILTGVLSNEEHSALLKESDICLVPQVRGSASSFLPSKLLKILAFGRPVLACAEADSPLGRAVVEGGFGRLIEPGDSKVLADTIANMLSDRNVLEQQSKCGLDYVGQFDQDLILSKYINRLEEVVR
jgi:colanic acid biosynthesis glycosyl transferase WcaI